MRRQIPVMVVGGLVLLSAGLAVMLVLSMRSFEAYQDKIDLESHANPRIVHADDVGDTSILYGYLDRPIGEEMTIEGAVIHDSPSVNFRVDSVDGAKVSGIRIYVLGAGSLPDAAAAKIRGTEVCQVMLTAPGDLKSSAADAKDKQRQVVRCAFKPMEVFEPKGIVLEEEKQW
jgi:hypothetical protein